MVSGQNAIRMGQKGRHPLRILTLLIAGGVAWAGACYFVATLCFTSRPAPRSTAACMNSGRRTSNVAASARGGARGGESSRSDAKTTLLDLLDQEGVAKEVLQADGKPIRGRIDDSILELERFNPTGEPSYSELFDGDWAVKYSGTHAAGIFSSPTRELALLLYIGGSSLGNALSSFVNGFWGQSLGMQLGPRTVQIKDGRDAEATAEIVLPSFTGRKETLRYKSELLPLSGRRFSEEIKFVELPAPLGEQSPPLDVRRDFVITYLDEGMMVVRDGSGVPEVMVRANLKAGEGAMDGSDSPVGEDTISSDAA